MIVKYIQYNHSHPSLELFISKMNELMYRKYASDLLKRLLRTSDFNMEESLRRTIAILRLTGISEKDHITGIYSSDSNGIRKDLQLSELACSLIILTSDSTEWEIKNIQDDLLNYLGL